MTALLLKRLGVLLVPMLLLCSPGCFSDDKKSTEPDPLPHDTTGPTVVSISPGHASVSVAVTEPVRIVFSEAMDDGSAEGQVTMTHGVVTSGTWQNDRTLVLQHTAWPEGTEVGLAVAEGLCDLAGNCLADEVEVSFITYTPVLGLLDTAPEDGAQDVPRNTTVRLLFSRRMNLATLAEAVTVTSGFRESIPFQASRGEEGWVILTFESLLPAASTVQVVVTTEALDEQGEPLAELATFSFVTGSDTDTTPPQIVSIEPASGAVVDPTLGWIRFEFSEPIDGDSFAPISANLEAWRVFGDVEPTWSGGGTILQVALPGGLAAGLPVKMAFQGYRDLNGVAQTSPTSWTIRVAGTPDYFPLVDGERQTFDFHEESGVIGSETPTEEYDGTFEYGIDLQQDGTFLLRRYEEDAPSEDWSIMRKAADGVHWLGLHQSNGDDELLDILFDDPLTVLPFPIQVGTTAYNSSADVSGIGTVDALWTVSVVERVDLPVASRDETAVYWTECWKVETSMLATVDDAPFHSEYHTRWYSPTVGLVREITESSDPGEHRWQRTENILRLPE